MPARLTTYEARVRNLEQRIENFGYARERLLGLRLGGGGPAPSSLEEALAKNQASLERLRIQLARARERLVVVRRSEVSDPQSATP
jgi:hypothetical protein